MRADAVPARTARGNRHAVGRLSWHAPGQRAAWAVAKASKGKRGGREVPLCGDLQDALGELQAFIPKRGPEDRVIFSERGVGISRRAIAIWFGRLYAELGFKSASSHSG